MVTTVPISCFICHKAHPKGKSGSSRVVWVCDGKCQRFLDKRIVAAFEGAGGKSAHEGYVAVQEIFADQEMAYRTAQRRTQASLGRMGRKDGPQTIKSRNKNVGRVDDIW